MWLLVALAMGLDLVLVLGLVVHVGRTRGQTAANFTMLATAPMVTGAGGITSANQVVQLGTVALVVIWPLWQAMVGLLRVRLSRSRQRQWHSWLECSSLFSLVCQPALT